MYKTILFIILCVHPIFLQSQSIVSSAVCRTDNDYCTFYDSISAKKTLPAKLNAFFKKKYPDTNCVNQIFEISFDTKRLYVVRFETAPSIFEYHFWIYDSTNNAHSSKPFIINGQWMHNQEEGFDVKLLQKPLACNENGFLWVKERRHNGNSYNAVIKYQLQCDKNLNLQMLQCVEEVSLCHFPDMQPDEYALFYRRLDGNECHCRMICQGEETDIGYFTVSKNGVISKPTVYNEKFENHIVTSSGIRPGIFIRYHRKLH